VVVLFRVDPLPFPFLVPFPFLSLLSVRLGRIAEDHPTATPSPFPPFFFFSLGFSFFFFPLFSPPVLVRPRRALAEKHPPFFLSPPPHRSQFLSLLERLETFRALRMAQHFPFSSPPFSSSLRSFPPFPFPELGTKKTTREASL